MGNKKSSFILYANYYDILKDLSFEDKGILFDAILCYQATGEILTLPDNLKIAFNFIKNQFDLDDKKYNEFSEKQKTNGLKGGRPKKEETQKNPKNPTVFLETQKSLNDNVNENVNVNVKCEAINTHAHDEVFSNLNEWYGEYKNVHLTKRQYDLLLNEILDKNKLNELIGELSENIACNTGKAPPYDDKSPDMHYAILRKYWRYRKLNGGIKPQTQSDKAKAFKDELDKLTEQYRLKEANSG